MSKDQIIEPPTWLDHSLFKRALQNGLKDESIEIDEFEIKPALAPGENYSSIIYRAKVMYRSSKGSSKSISLILKCFAEGEKVQEFLRSANFFEKEAKVLSEVLPKVQKMLEEKAPGKYPLLGARCFYFQGPPNDLLIMEDLSESGFRLADRHSGMDLEHTKLVVETLARYHAGSYVLEQKEHTLKKTFNESPYREEFRDMISNLVVGGVTALADEIETWDDYPQIYVTKLRNLKPNILEAVFEKYKRNENCLNVLCHGDTWVNNMMFRYDNERVQEMRLLDLQLAHFNSPVLDLNYFLFASPKQYVRDEHLDYILQYYLDSFHNVLQLLDTKVEFTFDELKEEFYKRLLVGLISTVSVLPLTALSPEDAFDVNELLDSSSNFGMSNSFKNEYTKSVMKKMLPFFEKHGVI